MTSKLEDAKAISAYLLSNPSACYEQVRLELQSSAPDLQLNLEAVSWFRRCIYTAIRFLEEGAINWNIPREKLRKAVEKKELQQITAAIWAVMKYPQEHDPREVAVVVVNSVTKGYVSETLSIFQEVKNFSMEKRKSHRNKLCEQIRPKQVCKLEYQIDMLGRLAKPTG